MSDALVPRLKQAADLVASSDMWDLLCEAIEHLESLEAFAARTLNDYMLLLREVSQDDPRNATLHEAAGRALDEMLRLHNHGAVTHPDFMVICRFCDRPDDPETDKRLAILGRMHEALGFGTLKHCTREPQ